MLAVDLEGVGCLLEERHSQRWEEGEAIAGSTGGLPVDGS